MEMILLGSVIVCLIVINRQLQAEVENLNDRCGAAFRLIARCESAIRALEERKSKEVVNPEDDIAKDLQEYNRRMQEQAELLRGQLEMFAK